MVWFCFEHILILSLMWLLNYTFWSLHSLFICACQGGVHAARPACEGCLPSLRVSPSTTQVPGIKVRSSGLDIGAFTHQAIPLAPKIHSHPVVSALVIYRERPAADTLFQTHAGSTK